MDRRIYCPAAGLSSWRDHLVDPDVQWVRGRSAFETAVFWELGARQPSGLHPTLAALLEQAEPLRECSLVASFPEHRVSIPGGSRASQTDVWALVRTTSGLLSLAVEGKAGESFATTIGEWRRDASEGKQERLRFLSDQLGLATAPQDTLRYQLLHRAASALIEAERCAATAAAVVVVSFADDARSKQDFEAFASCLGASHTAGTLCLAATVKRTPLYLGWLDVPACTDAELATVAV